MAAKVGISPQFVQTVKRERKVPAALARSEAGAEQVRCWRRLYDAQPHSVQCRAGQRPAESQAHTAALCDTPRRAAPAGAHLPALLGGAHPDRPGRRGGPTRHLRPLRRQPRRRAGTAGGMAPRVRGWVGVAAVVVVGGGRRAAASLISMPGCCPASQPPWHPHPPANDAYRTAPRASPPWLPPFASGWAGTTWRR